MDQDIVSGCVVICLEDKSVIERAGKLKRMIVVAIRARAEDDMKEIGNSNAIASGVTMQVWHGMVFIVFSK